MNRFNNCPAVVGQIAAQLVEVGQMVAAHHHRLGQRHHQLAGVQAALPLLERTHPVDRHLDGLDRAEAADEFAGQEQTGVTGECGVVVPDLDAGAGAATRGRIGTRHRCEYQAKGLLFA